jgi:hypothetical protein
MSMIFMFFLPLRVTVNDTSLSIWKEKNRRLFEGKSLSAQKVFNLARDEMALRKQALGTPCLC